MWCCSKSSSVDSVVTNTKPGSGPRTVQTLDYGSVAEANDKNRLHASRAKMEDELTVQFNYQNQESFFGVYDGHGGGQVAAYCRDNMHKLFFKNLQQYHDDDDLQRVWQETYTQLDTDLRTKLEGEGDADCAGSTSTTCYIAPEVDGWMVSVANAGDSKALLFSHGHCKMLTHTHRPTNEREIQRVKEAGGWFAGEKAKRLNGRLSVTRAVGDHYIKKTTKGLVCVPEIETIRVAAPSILVIASDGVWDFAEDDVQRFLQTEDVYSMSAQTISKHILDLSLKRHSNDNIAIVVVCFVTRRADDLRSSITLRSIKTSFG